MVSRHLGMIHATSEHICVCVCVCVYTRARRGGTNHVLNPGQVTLGCPVFKTKKQLWYSYFVCMFTTIEKACRISLLASFASLLSCSQWQHSAMVYFNLNGISWLLPPPALHLRPAQLSRQPHHSHAFVCVCLVAWKLVLTPCQNTWHVLLLLLTGVWSPRLNTPRKSCVGTLNMATIVSSLTASVNISDNLCSSWFPLL